MLEELQPSPERLRELSAWTEARFLQATLGLAGHQVDSREASRLSEAASIDFDTPPGRLLGGLRELGALVAEKGSEARFSTPLLFRLYDPSQTSVPDLRKSANPDQLLASLEGASRWFSTESFEELHPVEQASIALLRLFEIQPFEDRRFEMAVLAASLFTLRNQMPPLIIRGGDFEAALGEGLKMNTGPMVAFIARSLEATTREMIELVKKG